MTEEWQTWCPNCGCLRMGHREMPNRILHLLASVFTAGLWIPAWVILELHASSQPYLCSTCGAAGINS